MEIVFKSLLRVLITLAMSACDGASIDPIHPMNRTAFQHALFRARELLTLTLYQKRMAFNMRT
ncbi:MAG: hypothetical protein ACOC14_01185 [Bacillota bacterium]